MSNTKVADQEGANRDEDTNIQRPALPPRPGTLSFMQDTGGAGTGSRPPTRAGLLASATTALSMTDVNAHSRRHKDKDTQNQAGQFLQSPSPSKNPSRGTSYVAEDDSSIRSLSMPTKSEQDTESIFGGGLDPQTPQELGQTSSVPMGESVCLLDDLPSVDFDDEFLDLEDRDDVSEEDKQSAWKAKRKQFLILSAAGKLIYTRHGSDAIVSNYAGILQTIISTYDSWNSSLRTFTAGETKFVFLSETNLFLVGITSLPESDAQVRSQLDALYTQILSTLTLPNLTHIFSVRPSSDLRRPLQGTEVLLSALSDSFTRGSPSSLLSALECLRLRKAHRQAINSLMIKARVDSLLYGLIVAGGRLVSVIRPKKHSLHPGDLHLIFNMLFEAEGIKAGGGDSFIPICLPGFNNTGYLYMYVSFLDTGSENVRELDEDEKIAKEDAVAIILLSTSKESFEELRSMKTYLVHELRKSGSMRLIQKAVQNGRPSPTDIVPGSALRHFLYKSKGNVQFFMPALGADFETPRGRRQLFSLYHLLHSSVHKRHATVRVQHSINASSSALAWITPMFELYCVASSSTPRNALAQNANKVVQWIQREEERIFLIGGAVF